MWNHGYMASNRQHRNQDLDLLRVKVVTFFFFKHQKQFLYFLFEFQLASQILLYYGDELQAIQTCHRQSKLAF